MVTYRVVAKRNGNWWMVDVPEVDVHTHVGDLVDIEPMARAMIARAVNADPYSFGIEVERLPRRV